MMFSFLLQKYHPTRALTLVYQPFALGTMAILAYNESKIDTRKRNITGYTIFFASTLALLLVSSVMLFLHCTLIINCFQQIYVWFATAFWQLDLATSGEGGLGPFLGVCVFVALFGVADAHVQGGIVGDLSFMYPEFMQVDISNLLWQLFLIYFWKENLFLTTCWHSVLQSFFAGLAASGALTSGLRLLTKAAFEKSHDGLRKGVSTFLFSSIDKIWFVFLFFNCKLVFSLSSHYVSRTARKCWFFSYSVVLKMKSERTVIYRLPHTRSYINESFFLSFLQCYSWQYVHRLSLYVFSYMHFSSQNSQ